MSVMGPGFDVARNLAVSALASHDGHLYAGTSTVGAASGRPQLWCSADGEVWREVTWGGDEPLRLRGVSRLLSMSRGLLVGGDAGPGAPGGGCEVWVAR
jgi:hypothetical protein